MATKKTAPPPSVVPPSLLRRLAAYKKTATAVVGAGLTWATTALGDGNHVTQAEWLGLAVALAGVFGVYQVENSQPEVSDADSE